MEHYRDIASKSADNAARIAGLFHLFNDGDVLDTINGATMEAATQLAAWHLYEARRFFSEIAVPTDLSNAIKLDSWLIQYCRNNHTDHVGKRETRQLAPNRLRNSQ
jgi:putative DNA primase/helicase